MFLRYAGVGKATFTAPLYVGVAWTLIISYQLFTQTAVTSVVTALNVLCPSLGSWLAFRIDIVVFIHAFAWIFVLSSVIPSVILGKGRGVLVQFFLCLTLVLVAMLVEDTLTFTIRTQPIHQFRSLLMGLQNPIVAGACLSIPYFSMLYLDIRSRKKPKVDLARSKTENTNLFNR
jgi:hypothetical protein